MMIDKNPSIAGSLPTRVIGVGDSLRHDSEAGLAVARQVSVLESEVETIECAGDGRIILEALTGTNDAFIIGAVASGERIGYVRFDVNHDRPPSRLLYASRHLFSVMEALELSRTFNRLPERCILYGIAGADFSKSEGLSREVLSACEIVAGLIVKEIHQLKHSDKGAQRYA